jgi:hypothetical protein
METSLQNRIQERAYHLWNAGGQVHGQAEQHWLAAEREILAQMTAEPRVSQSVTPAKIVRQRRPRPKKTEKAS